MNRERFGKFYIVLSLVIMLSLLLAACRAGVEPEEEALPTEAVEEVQPEPTATAEEAMEPEATEAPSPEAEEAEETQPPAAEDVEIMEPVTLRVLGFVVPPEERGTPLDMAYQEFLSTFQEQNSNVTLESLETPPEFDTQLLVDLAAGTAPDVWQQDASTLARLVDGGYVLDMRQCVELIPSFNMDRFFENVLEIHQREDGAIYGVPNDFTPMVIYYNPVVFEELGVEPPEQGWTWDDLLEKAQQLTVDANGNHPTDPGFDPNNVEHWGFRVRQFAFEWIYRVWENGGDVISPDGTTASGYLDSEETIETITFHRDLVSEHQVAPPPDVLDQMDQQLGFLDRFLRGDVVMFDRGHWELVGLRNSPEYTGENFFVAPQPIKENGATVIYESGWMIRNDLEGEQLKAACKFVEAATSRMYQDTKAITGIAIAANREAAIAAAEAAENPELEQVFIDQVEEGRLPYGALYPNWPTVEEILDNMMEQILAGADVQGAVDDAVTEINRELGQ